MLTVLSSALPMPAAILNGFATDLDSLSVVVRLGVAAVLGALIGFERKMADKPADGRTMMLICAGAAAFVILGVQIASDPGAPETTRVDPTRVLSYIISGVGFLGAGAILHNKKSVMGLTTAAAVWVAAAIGAACGLAKFDTALMLFGIVIIALWTPWMFNITKDDDEDDDRLPSFLGGRTSNGKGSGKGNSHSNGNGTRVVTPPTEPEEPANKSGKGDKNEKPSEKGDKPNDKGDKSKGDKDKNDKPDKDKSDKGSKNDKADKGEKSDKGDKPKGGKGD